MGEKRIVVPEGMMKAVVEHHPARGFLEDDPKLYATTTLEAVLEAALRWLSENPIVPTKEQCDSIYDECPYNDMEDYRNRLSSQWAFTEWQRRMFLAPEPEIPEAIKDFVAWVDVWFPNDSRSEDLKTNFAAAYRRGQQSREK